MTTIDKSYVEKLREVLYDEKKAINYKTVSVMLGVHVNIAKQMLYHLHKAANGEEKKLYPTYYVSGMMPRKMIMSLQKKNTDEIADSSKQLSGGDNDAYLVTLCREKGLEELKAKFSKIFSVHMYSLSAFPIENYDVLNNLVEFPLRGINGHTPIDFGPIICSASQKLLANSRPVPVPVVNDLSKTKSEVKNEVVKKSDSVKESGKDFFKSSNTNGSKSEESSKNGIVESKSQKVAKPAPPAPEKKDRLKSMFAAAATKPKPQKVEKPDTKKPDSNIEKNSKALENKDKKESSSARSKSSRKRKRIRDVLSSDSEGEEKNSEDDEDSPPDSPVQRKRIQIDSDSDDDVMETRTKTPEPEVAKEEKTAIPSGRKRVAKMVSKSYMDKDGFLVTTKEQIMVSEDEDDVKSKVKEEPKKPKVESKTVNGSSKSSPDKPSAKSTASKNASGKTKQASLMSFFQKK